MYNISQKPFNESNHNIYKFEDNFIESSDCNNKELCEPQVIEEPVQFQSINWRTLTIAQEEKRNDLAKRMQPLLIRLGVAYWNLNAIVLSAEGISTKGNTITLSSQNKKLLKIYMKGTLHLKSVAITINRLEMNSFLLQTLPSEIILHVMSFLKNPIDRENFTMSHSLIYQASKVYPKQAHFPANMKMTELQGFLCTYGDTIQRIHFQDKIRKSGVSFKRYQEAKEKKQTTKKKFENFKTNSIDQNNSYAIAIINSQYKREIRDCDALIKNTQFSFLQTLQVYCPNLETAAIGQPFSDRTWERLPAAQPEPNMDFEQDFESGSDLFEN